MNWIADNIQYNTNFHSIESTKLPKNNKSGCKGVFHDLKHDCYTAYISLHGKRHHLGRFTKFTDAVNARKAAEQEYFLPLIEQKNRDRKGGDGNG